MDCGIPFCHTGCPLGNLIPEWNDLVYRDDWRDAIERLHATNNFPEFTGRLCPAPCEAACVLGINEHAGHDQAGRGRDRRPRVGTTAGIVPRPADRAHGQARRGRRLRSGRARGRAAAHARRPRRHGVRARRPHRRAAALRHPRVQDGEAPPRPAPRADGGRGHRVPRRTRTSARTSPVDELQRDFDAIVLAGGATAWRDLPIPGRELTGIYQAMEFLPPANRVQEGDLAEHPITRRGQARRDHRRRRHRRRLPRHRRIRQGAATIHQFEILPRPPDARPDANPWPTWPMIYRTSSAHEEGGERVFAVNTECFLGDDDGNVRALRAHEVEQKIVDGRMTFEKVEGTDFELPCELVLLAMGFVGPQRDGPARAARRRAQRARQRRPRRRAGARTSTACSSAATWAAARASSCGRSPRAARARRRSTSG